MSERLTVEDVKWHILDAFDMLKERCQKGAALQEAHESEALVTAFLAQCEDDAKRLESALKACQWLAKADTRSKTPDLAEAISNARAALAD